MKKKIRLCLFIVTLCIIIVPMTAFGHSGRTDSSGGHRDNQNKSGLGYYHYHCGGNPPHLHPGGVCPYGSGYNANTYSKPTPSITINNPPSELAVGDNYGLDYEISNYNDYDATIVSSDENIVLVNDDGSLTALSEGTATITISSNDLKESFLVTVKSVPTESVSIVNPTNKIQLDTNVRLYASISPENATYQKLNWSSSDNNIASVDENGEVKALATGSAIISCETVDGIKTEMPFEVYEVYPNDIQVSDANLRIERGDTKYIQIDILPYEANNKSYDVHIDNTNVAEFVNERGVIAHNDGNANLTIKTHNGITKMIPIEVYHIPVKKLTIDDSEIRYEINPFHKNAIHKDERLKLSTHISPQNATDQYVEWESSDSNIISIINNVPKIVGTGAVTLTTNAADNQTATIELNVIDYNIWNIITFIIIGCIVIFILIYIIVNAIKEKKH